MNADTIGKLCGAVGVIAGLAAAWGTASYMYGGGAGSLLPAGRYPVILLIIIFVGPPIAVGLAVGFGVTFVLALGLRGVHESRRRLDPSYEAEILQRRGQTDATLGNHDRSIASYSEAIRLKPNDARTYYLRAQAHEAKNDWGKAKADYDEAIRIDPNYLVAYIDRGALAFNKLNDAYGAIADSRRALQLAPDNKTVISNLDIIYRSKQADDATVAALTEAIKSNPQDAQALTQRGRAYCIRGDDARAAGPERGAAAFGRRHDGAAQPRRHVHPQR